MSKRPAEDEVGAANGKAARQSPLVPRSGPQTTFKEIQELAFQQVEYDVNRSVGYEEEHPESSAVLVPAFVHTAPQAVPGKATSLQALNHDFLWRWTPGTFSSYVGPGLRAAQPCVQPASSMLACCALAQCEALEHAAAVYGRALQPLTLPALASRPLATMGLRAAASALASAVATRSTASCRVDRGRDCGGDEAVPRHRQGRGLRACRREGAGGESAPHDGPATPLG